MSQAFSVGSQPRSSREDISSDALESADDILNCRGIKLGLLFVFWFSVGLTSFSLSFLRIHSPMYSSRHIRSELLTLEIRLCSMNQ